MPLLGTSPAIRFQPFCSVCPLLLWPFLSLLARRAPSPTTSKSSLQPTLGFALSAGLSIPLMAASPYHFSPVALLLLVEVLCRLQSSHPLFPYNQPPSLPRG
ncbi:hypothetical protein GOP47_0001068 [Adiantum capillus-veneris]|uniref:Uncharacterized protein n=1 Tax=Adiantum capillus-veneris TaxID=13818 RepID=A0A9D4VEH0_ADICA|nr:hypothetical protein GOP47_0001068 [Adiantum capillus-veneris]